MATATTAIATTALPPRPSVARPPRSDVAGDLLAVAWAAGAAPPREVRVRPELLARLSARPGAVVDGLLGDPAGVPVVVDPQLPRSPGFEVRRVPPH